MACLNILRTSHSATALQSKATAFLRPSLTHTRLIHKRQAICVAYWSGRMASLASFSRMGARVVSTAARTAPRTAMQVRDFRVLVLCKRSSHPASSCEKELHHFFCIAESAVCFLCVWFDFRRRCHDTREREGKGTEGEGAHVPMANRLYCAK